MSEDKTKKTLTCEEFCNIKGVSNHKRFFLNKVYGKESFSKEIWEKKLKE